MEIKTETDKPVKLFFKFTKYLFPYCSKELAIFILSIATVLLSLVNPFLTKIIVDKAIAGKDLGKFIVLALIAASVFVINGLLKAASDYLEKVLRLRVIADLTKDIFLCLQKLSIDWFQDRASGEHVYKINYDLERVADLITVLPQKVITVLGGLIFTIIVLLFLNWQLTVLSLLIMPFVYLSQRYFNKKINSIWSRIIEKSEELFKKLTELFSHIKLIKVFACEGLEIKKYLDNWLINVDMQVKNAKLDIIAVFAGSAVSKVIIGSIAFYGGYQVIKGQLTLGTLTAVMVYLGQLFGLGENLGAFWRLSTRGLVSCGRVNRLLLEEPKLSEAVDAKDLTVETGDIEVKNLSFGYKTVPVLDRLTFNIESGSFIAIAGRSGCGKTTFLNLLLRLYDPWQGDILINGYSLKDLKFSSLRGHIGIAMQEPFLWNDSIYNNIKYPLEDTSEDRVMKVAQLAGIDTFVRELPNRYAAIIGENGCSLSEGQKQRIAIARALIKEPGIIILDEALSSVDSESEERIIKNIRKVYNRATLIVVSHRLSSVKGADRVYFFKKPGEVVISSPQEMIRNEKEFHDLFAPQIKGGLAE